MTEFATAERKRIEAEQAKEQARLEKLADKAELKTNRKQHCQS